MGLCGNAILPLIYGYLADIYNLQMAYVVLIPCYLYLIFYAIIGHQIRNWSRQ
jgi:fucose permease